MVTAVVWVLAGVTAWCVASLALALIVGPMIRRGQHVERNRWRRTGHVATGRAPRQQGVVVPLHPRR